jgi:CYTH domain-containing protein
MALEIERKYLVNINDVDLNKIIQSETGVYIAQGYLNTDLTKTVRVRVKGSKGYLTIKGIQVGVSKPEYEYEIPLADANEMLAMCDVKVLKTRYIENAENGLVWEIDVFKGLNDGLIVAEIELPSEDTPIILPAWIKSEVSSDLAYANSNLGIKPYSTWF